GRVAHRAELISALEARTAGRGKAELLAALEDAAVPAGPINSVAEVFANPQVEARQLRLDMPAKETVSGTIPGVRTPIDFSDTPLAHGRPAPRLGADSEAVLVEIGLSGEKIAELRAKGV